MLQFLQKLKFHFFLYGVLGLTIIGELYRIPLATENGIILTDVFVPALVGLSFFYKLATEPRHQWTNHPKVFRYFLTFVLIALLSLLLSIPNFESKELLIAAMYLIRFISYGFLGLLVYQETKTSRQAKQTLFAILIASLFLALAGFIQMIVYPDLAPIVELGWDPHQNRLVSTWLDPNFVGGFLAFIFSLGLAYTLHLKKGGLKYGLIASLVIIEFAIFLTYSRSAYLAFLAGAFVVTMLKSPKVFLIIIIIFGLQVSSSSYAVQRVFSMIFNLDMVFSAESKDPTANFRVRSWLDTIALAKEKPLLGHGYNNLATVKNQRQLVHAKSQHSASGSDSSLLTILASTGIIGFIPFFLFYLITFLEAKKVYLTKQTKQLSRSTSLGVLGGISVLFIHSIFVNSLLYPPILLIFFVIWGVFESTQNSSSSQNT